MEGGVHRDVVRRFDLSPAVRPRRKGMLSAEAANPPPPQRRIGQCRIGFQPVSPDDRTARRESKSSSFSISESDWSRGIRDEKKDDLWINRIPGLIRAFTIYSVRGRYSVTSCWIFV